jgi:hypothetical protein
LSAYSSTPSRTACAAASSIRVRSGGSWVNRQPVCSARSANFSTTRRLVFLRAFLPIRLNTSARSTTSKYVTVFSSVVS